MPTVKTWATNVCFRWSVAAKPTWTKDPHALGRRVRVALAWACGTGSLLTLDALEKEGHEVTLLHLASGVPDFVVEAQAAALALPLHQENENNLAALTRALEKLQSERVAFGYLRGEDHSGWKTGKASRAASVEPMLPVRHASPGEAARDFVARGHRAFVWQAPEAETLGRFLDDELIEDIDARLGRAGWGSYRFLAVDGPRFARRVDVMAGEAHQEGDAYRLGLGLKGC